MKYQKKLVGAIALGLAGVMLVPMSANGAAPKKKVTTKPKKTTAPKATTPPPATTAPQAAPPPASGRGGKIVYGIGAESSGWLPATQNWAPEGTQVRYSILENLMAVNDKGVVVGYLAESAAPSADFKTWTFKLRPNIKFSNGEAFNAAAVVANITSVQKGPLTGPALFNLQGCAAAGDLVVACAMRSRWVSFPYFLTGSLGAMAAPAYVAAADGTKGPIGTGPFVFKEWIPGQKFVATKNPSYWRGPVLADEVEFRVIIDDEARRSQLESGQLNFSHTSAAVAVNDYLAASKGGKFKTLEAAGPAQTNYDLLNTAVAPFNVKECRLAAYQAMDLDTLIKLRAPGFTKANGPFSPGSLGSLPNNGSPKFDLDASKANYEKCKAANEGKDVAFTMATTTATEAIETRNVKKQMVERAGFKITTVEIPQQTYIPAAIVGRFQWLTWRNHGGSDPDGERIWWHSETAAPVNSQALNFGRVKDGTIDAALDQIRSNSDPAVRKKAAESINQAFGEEAYFIPNWYSRWILGYGNKCGGVEDFRLPNGDKVYSFNGGATPALAYMGCSA
jgi:peptide/nickel transport system substrate-binding protein